jgi:hypothetical protein
MKNPAPTSLATMSGHGKCENGHLCSYHEGKVFNSVCPGPEVYGEAHVRAVDELLNKQDVANISVEDLVKNSLYLVDQYWSTHSGELNDGLITAHRAEYKKAQEENHYLAGGWMASPQQFSQLYAVMWAMHKMGHLNSDSQVLRLGTASGAHSKQLARVFPMVEEGLNPDLTIMDLCDSPLEDSRDVTENLVVGDVVTEMRDLIGEASMDVVEAHVITSFIPAKNSPDASDHGKSLAAKLRLFSNANHVLKSGGLLCMCIGTSPKDPRRFNNEEEIVKSIEEAGFRDVTIVETTDPLDYTDGHYDEGNFIVAAFK